MINNATEAAKTPDTNPYHVRIDLLSGAVVEICGGLRLLLTDVFSRMLQ